LDRSEELLVLFYPRKGVEVLLCLAAKAELKKLAASLQEGGPSVREFVAIA